MEESLPGLKLDFAMFCFKRRRGRIVLGEHTSIWRRVNANNMNILTTRSIEA